MVTRIFSYRGRLLEPSIAHRDRRKDEQIEDCRSESPPKIVIAMGLRFHTQPCQLRIPINRFSIDYHVE